MDYSNYVGTQSRSEFYVKMEYPKEIGAAVTILLYEVFRGAPMTTHAT